MKVLVVGGGSGGHITPAMSVIRELLLKYPNTQVEFWTDRKYLLIRFGGHQGGVGVTRRDVGGMGRGRGKKS